MPESLHYYSLSLLIVSSMHLWQLNTSDLDNAYTQGNLGA
jgi:hypothetical protein